MAARPAPTAPHPPPAPDWILGRDGHWKPPTLSADGSPTRIATPESTPDGDRTEEHASTSSGPGAGVILAVILVVLAVAYLAWISLDHL